MGVARDNAFADSDENWYAIPQSYYYENEDDTPECEERSEYTVKVYTKCGYFKYTVPEMSSALEHAQEIAERGVYRRSRPDGAVEFHRVVKVKVEGEGLASECPDEFCRT